MSNESISETRLLTYKLVEECAEKKLDRQRSRLLNNLLGDCEKEEERIQRKSQILLDIIERIESIDFSFNNLINIDALWKFKNLKILHLENNNIEKIENIGHLQSLEHLDLSFNNIREIECLDNQMNPVSLRRLATLSLFHNKLESCKGVEVLAPNVTILSLGHNFIRKEEDYLSIFKLKMLKSLNISNNLSNNDDDNIFENVKTKVLAKLNSIAYFNNITVSEKEVIAAKDKHFMSLETEKQAKADEEKNQAELAEKKIFDDLLEVIIEYEKDEERDPQLTSRVYQSLFNCVENISRHLMAMECRLHERNLAAINEWNGEENEISRKQSDKLCEILDFSAINERYHNELADIWSVCVEEYADYDQSYDEIENLDDKQKGLLLDREGSNVLMMNANQKRIEFFESIEKKIGDSQQQWRDVTIKEIKDKELLRHRSNLRHCVNLIDWNKEYIIEYFRNSDEDFGDDNDMLETEDDDLQID
ncbi:MAG: hypothetical protein MHMPM18_000158 [Marteilia pararefringens]